MEVVYLTKLDALPVSAAGSPCCDLMIWRHFPCRKKRLQFSKRMKIFSWKWEMFTRRYNIEQGVMWPVATLSDLVVQKILTEMAMVMMPRMMEKLIWGSGDNLKRSVSEREGLCQFCRLCQQTTNPASSLKCLFNRFHILQTRIFQHSWFSVLILSLSPSYDSEPDILSLWDVTLTCCQQRWHLRIISHTLEFQTHAPRP